MADNNIILKIDQLVFTLSFTKFDAYCSTPLGCHAGLLGSFHGGYKQKDGKFDVGTKEAGEVFKKGHLARRIMDAFVESAPTGWGGYDKKSATSYPKKGHIIISAPWSYNEQAVGGVDPTFGTQEMMDIIEQFCRKEPQKYGVCVITPPTDCAAHGNNAGFPATRTLVWMPPYVEINPNKVKTRCTGVYRPEKPKKIVEPKAISVV